MTCSAWRNQVAAYLDSELEAGALAALEDHLRTCSSCAAEALGRLQMKRAIHTAGARYSPTPQFRRKLERRIRAKGRPWPAAWMPRLAIATAAVVLLVASVFLWSRYAEQKRALTEFADLHVSTLASAHPVDVVSTDRHTVKPWFAGKLPFTFSLPDLQNSPFQLAGGRVAYLGQSPGAQLLFQLRQHYLSAFILQDRSRTVPVGVGRKTAHTLNFNVESWAEGGLRYTVVSDASPGDVHQLAELLRQAARP